MSLCAPNLFSFHLFSPLCDFSLHCLLVLPGSSSSSSSDSSDTEEMRTRKQLIKFAQEFLEQKRLSEALDSKEKGK